MNNSGLLQDNGTGIYKDDLPLVCERFATSKLRSVSSLLIAVFNFARARELVKNAYSCRLHNMGKIDVSCVH